MNIAFKDYYKVLDIPQYADINAIKTAFRLKAKASHPDSTKHNNYAQFVLVREAYDILTDPHQRARYDTVWNTHHGKADISAESLYEDFGPPDDRYAQEWEYFVMHPEDYLSRFESLLSLIRASVRSMVISICIPLLVIASILIAGTITLLVFFIFVVTLASYSSAFAGIILAIIFVKRFIELTQTLFAAYTHTAALWIIKQLKGIPMAIGKMVLYGAFTSFFFLLILYALTVILSFNLFESIPYSHFFMLSAGIIAIAVVSVSLYFVLAVFTNALIHYPKIRYTKILSKKENLLESKLLLR